jgi:hypothetical protein
VFCSFFTPSGNYPLLAKKLVSSLDAFNLNHDIVMLDRNFESWEKGTHFKSQFILSMLLKHRKAIVWLDIDTEVWQFPSLLFGEHELAIYNWFADKDHHLDGKIDYCADANRLFCSGGVQKWGYTVSSMHLILVWIDLIRRGGEDIGDDLFLDQAFNVSDLDMNCLWLPKVYNRMDKHTRHWSSIPEDDVVINHDYTAGKHRSAKEQSY